MRRFNVLVAVIAILVAVYASRMAVATPDVKMSAATIGAKAPDFSLQNYDGKQMGLGDYAGKITVLEWVNPECPYVQRHYKAKTMQTLADQYKNDGVVWLSINTTHSATNEFDKQWVADQNISYPVLNDAAGDVGKAYHATNTPELYIIGKDGLLLYKGAIDNDPEGDKGAARVNYVQKAMGEILAGKTVSEPETKAYGCSVKYAK